MNKLKRGCLIMSCGSGQCNCNQYGGSGGSGQGCIRDVIRRIIEAQKRVENTTSIACATSCERSIEDLLSPSRDNRPPRHTTVPFMLINKCGKPFIGSGIVKDRKSTRLNSSHVAISYAVFCLKKKKTTTK